MNDQPTKTPAWDKKLLANTTDCNDWYLALNGRCYLCEGVKERLAVRQITINFVGNDWEPVPFSETKDLAKMVLAIYRARWIAWVVDHNASNNLSGCRVFEGQ